MFVGSAFLSLLESLGALLYCVCVYAEFTVSLVRISFLSVQLIFFPRQQSRLQGDLQWTLVTVSGCFL